MRFLAAGIDTAVIALCLSHESTATTSIYLHADMDIKRRGLSNGHVSRRPSQVTTRHRTHSSHGCKPCDYAEQSAHGEAATRNNVLVSA
jgi:hypothetical protein